MWPQGSLSMNYTATAYGPILVCVQKRERQQKQEFDEKCVVVLFTVKMPRDLNYVDKAVGIILQT